LTKGGSLIGPFSGNQPIRHPSLRGGADSLAKARGVIERTRPAGESVSVGSTLSARPRGFETEVPPIPGWKRIIDCLCIGLLAPIWLPLALVIACWIKIVSPGSVFYRQARIGRGGQVFNILKFRSMKVDAPTSSHEQHLEQLIRSDVPMAKLDGVADPRIIPGGRCLRAIGLDELPQLWNVMRGEMSLVGPRPSTPNEYLLFTEVQKSRVEVLPGLTGYWQVSGKNKLTFQQMIALDLQYTKRMSLGLDVAIMLATVPAMLLQYMESRPAKEPQPARTAEAAAHPG